MPNGPAVSRKVRLLKLASRAALYYTLQKKYRNRRRILVATQSLLFALVIGITTILQTWFQISPPTYALDATIKNIVGESRDDTAEYLREDVENAAFAFEVPKAEDSGDKVHTGRKTDAYSATLPKDAKAGVRFTDTENKIDISIAPKFKTYPGQKVDGDHIVYLAKGGIKLVYTLKYNGLKEDIILPHYMGDELSFDFELSLPTGVEARLDDGGNIGIYSSDPTLFGDISFGSDDDRARVDTARENGLKNNLVSSIPAPILKDATGSETTKDIWFNLSQKTVTENDELRPDLPSGIPRMRVKNNTYTLSIKSKSLKDYTYPVSLDPTMLVRSANQFDNVTVEYGVDTDTTLSSIRRDRVTGALTTWGSSTAIPSARWNFDAVVYGNRVYIAGGGDGALNDVHSAPFSGSGIGAWTSTENLSIGRSGHQLLAYNGFLYILGGLNGSTRRSDVDYARFKDGGGLAADSGCGTTWCDANNFTTARTNFSAEVYNGYMYIVGGWGDSTINLADVQYAPINADGTLGTWTATSSLIQGRRNHSTAIYNGYIYAVAGSGTSFNAGGISTSIEYAKFNSNGTISSWLASDSSLAVAIDMFGLEIVSGYMYVINGCSAYQADGDCNTRQTIVRFAQVNADGTIDTQWNATNTTTGRSALATISHRNIIMTFGGCGADSSNDASCNALSTLTANTSIDTVGRTSPYTSVSTMNRVHSSHETIACYGYIYAIAGIDNAGTTLSAVDYAAINANGSLGTWAETTSYPLATNNAASPFCANGRIYTFSGNTASLGNENRVYYATPAADGSISSWIQSGTTPIAVSHNDSAVYNNYVYIIGGRQHVAGIMQSTVLSSVYYAPINDDGTLGSWQSTTSLTTGRWRHAAIAYAGHIYVLGGMATTSTADPTLSSVERATLNSNGTVSAWDVDSSDSSFSRADISAFAYNGMICMSGGVTYPDATITNLVRCGFLDTDRNLTSWSTNQALATARQNHSFIESNGYIYAVGGWNGTERTAEVISARIHYGGYGSLTNYTVDTGGNFANARKLHGSVAYNGYLYVVGGCINSSCGTSTTQTTNIISYAPINADGSIGTWSNTSTTFTGNRMRPLVFAYNNRMYVMGGRNYEATGQDRDDIRYASINADGNITGSWTLDNTDLPGGTGHFGASIAQFRDTIYFTGGGNTTNQDDVFYSVIDGSTGDMANWIETTSRPTTSRHAWLTVYDGYLYSIGGNNSLINSVFSTPINSDMTLGSWSQTTSLPKNSYSNAHSMAIARNGYIYVIYDLGPNNIPETYYAPILQSGRIGNWQSTTMPDYGAGASYLNFSVAFAEGKAYVTGGHITGGVCDPCTQTTYATLKSMFRGGSFTLNYNFDQAVRPTTLISRGTKQSSSDISIIASYNLNCSANGYNNSQTFTNPGLSAAERISLDPGPNMHNPRCTLLRYTVDDSQSSTFRDTTQATSISSIDFYFNPSPQGRLRGGRTFTNGVDRGLDAQP